MAYCTHRPEYTLSTARLSTKGDEAWPAAHAAPSTCWVLRGHRLEEMRCGTLHTPPRVHDEYCEDIDLRR
jgi:hypothetical protein